VKKKKLREEIVFFHLFGSLLTSGINLVQALSYLADFDFSQGLRDVANEWLKTVNEGTPLSSAPNIKDNFAPWIIDMIKIGEESGQLDIMCLRISECLEVYENYMT